jgi:hypothetical protein
MFNQVIIWGHKLHSHTHSYIHYGFNKAFKYMGYKCLWLDNNYDISNIDFSNSLFITEGQVDKNIPIRNDCIYLLHNCDKQKYSNINNVFNIQVITETELNKYSYNKCPYEYGYCSDNQLLLCWATDLLPDDILYNINLVKTNNIISTKNLNFIGMPLYPWDEVKKWCDNNGYTYTNRGGFSNNVTSEENMKLIQESILAPAFQESWQVKNGYIPCRIFKNISYGKMGITNNRFVNDLFNKKLIYGENIHDTLNVSLSHNNKDTLIELMNEVKNKHTYINRVNLILWFLRIHLGII